MSDTTTTTRPLSISALRLFTQCGYAWNKRYVLGQRGLTHARAWRGTLTHKIIHQAYKGIPLPEATKRAWEAVAGPIMPRLVEWASMDDEYTTMDARTKAAKTWLEAHPKYHELEARVDAFRAEALGHLRWNDKDSLTGFYRTSRQLAARPATELLLPNPLLVEGKPLDEFTPSLDIDAAVDEDGEPTNSLGLLHGDIWGVPIFGVPDVVAQADDGAKLVLDYKTGKTRLTAEELAEDAQMALYVELLRQQGHIANGEPVRVGHRYLTDKGEILTVWSEANRQPKLLERIGQQMATARALIDAGVFMPARGIDPAMGPCSYCSFKHSCDA